MKFLLLFLLILTEFSSFTHGQQVSFNNTRIKIELNIYGRIRIYVQEREFFDNITLLVGTAQDRVFDFRNDAGLEDSISELNLKYHELYGGFNNSYSNLPPEIIERVNIYSPPNESFALFRFNVINDSDTLINAKIGLDINSKIGGTFGFDSVKYVDSTSIVDIYKVEHFGFKLIIDSLSTLAASNWVASYSIDSNYWNWLNSGIIDTVFVSGSDGPVVILSQPFVNINPRDSVLVYYAVAHGFTDSMMQANIKKAESMFISLTPVEENFEVIPSDFSLSQNYPNPFNPETRISFSIPGEELVSLKVYSLLGEEVEVIVQEKLQAGTYTFNFSGSGLASGIYFYKLTAGKFSQAKKMILIK